MVHHAYFFAGPIGDCCIILYPRLNEKAKGCASLWQLMACGDGGEIGAETLILCGFAGLFAGNVVVFLRKLKWISYRGSGDGVTPCEFHMWFIMGFAGEFVHFGKTL